MIPWLKLTTNVFIDNRFCGGVAMTENSLRPSIAKDKVLGIGVAVSASTSTFFLKALSFSFCLTPNLCSSSITTKPRSLNLISGCKRRCVPMMMSIFPSCNRCNDSFCCFFDLNRDISSILIGHLAKRSQKLSKCCSANKVVGTKTIACFPFRTEINAALSATSVLPKPTSPQTNLSIGLEDSISSTTRSIASF